MRVVARADDRLLLLAAPGRSFPGRTLVLPELLRTVRRGFLGRLLLPFPFLHGNDIRIRLKLGVDPQNDIAGLARAWEASGQHAKAEETIRTAIALRPDYWPFYASLARHYWQRGMLAEAETSYRKVLALTPENYWACNNLGGLLLAAGRRDEARGMFERSLALKPSYAAYSNLGTIAFGLGNWGEAVALYEHALALDDRDYQVWGNLGSAAHWLGGALQRERSAFSRAIALAERGLEVNPKDTEVLADIASYRAMLGEAGAARQGLVAIESAARRSRRSGAQS
jgi:serine/threonine-protein kinase